MNNINRKISDDLGMLDCIEGCLGHIDLVKEFLKSKGLNPNVNVGFLFDDGTIHTKFEISFDY